MASVLWDNVLDALAETLEVFLHAYVGEDDTSLKSVSWDNFGGWNNFATNSIQVCL